MYTKNVTVNKSGQYICGMLVRQFQLSFSLGNGRALAAAKYANFHAGPDQILPARGRNIHCKVSQRFHKPYNIDHRAWTPDGAVTLRSANKQK